MKKVLLIATEFPPTKYVGRVRTVKFAKYLRFFGWKPVILTPTAFQLWTKDYSLLSEIPEDVNVYRAFCPPMISFYPRFLKSLFFRANTGIPTSTADAGKEKGQILRGAFVALINKIENFMRRHILIPDEYIMWLPFALFKAIRIVKRENVDAVYSTVHSATDHIIACCVKTITKKPWVADYRDFWTSGNPSRRLGFLRQKVEEMIEKTVLSKADIIIAVSEPMIEILRKQNPDISRDKFMAIANGFDRDDFKYLNVKKNPEKFIITYTGRLYEHESGIFFLTAIGDLLSENRGLRDKMQIRFIGEVYADEKIKLDKLIEDYGLGEAVLFMGYLSHKECLEYQIGSDVLLLLLTVKERCDYFLTAKIFDYIASKRPILGLVPEGAAKDLIIKTKTGVVMDPYDIDKIKRSILNLYEQWQEGRLRIEPDYYTIAEYDRKNLTRKLGGILDNISK